MESRKDGKRVGFDASGDALGLEAGGKGERFWLGLNVDHKARLISTQL
jgi:hypothetical protein